MTKRLLIDATHHAETRVAILDEDSLDHFDFVSTAKRQLKGNIYLGKITRVEPSLQAAFVEYGGGKQGFLSFSEIHPDYYQIPVADRKRLMEEAAAAAEAAEREEEEAYAAEEARAARGHATVDRQEHDDSEDQAHHVSEPGDASTHEPHDEGDYPSASDVAPVEEAHDQAHPAPLDPDATEQGPDAAAETEGSPTEDGAEPSPEGDAPKRRGRRRVYGARGKQARSRPARNMETAEAVDDDEHRAPGVETVSEEDADSVVRKPRQSFSRRYKIQEVIKAGQIVLVQVVKEERGNKGCSLSTFISLPGRYCVLMPNSPKDGGISRKIGSNTDRKRLKDIATELRESRGMSAIIRTAGIDRTKTEIKRDYDYLIKLWGTTRDLALSSTAPALVYEEGNLVKRTIRDYYNAEIDEVLVQGEESYKSAKDFMKMIMPSHAARVKLFKETQPIFNAYGVEEQLAELYLPMAPLPSGGYLVINPTEALISVDVNSGRSTTERNVEETAFKTNLEAAEEVARQLRLRDLGGLVVIDFIDMGYGKHRRAVEKALKDALKDDRAKVQVGHISAFGLLELSRQRLGASLFEATTHACPLCKGIGAVRSPEATAMAIVRELESEAFEGGQGGEYRIRLSLRDAMGMMNQYRPKIAAIEAEYAIRVIFEIDAEMTDGVFTIDNGKGGGSHHRRHQDARPARRRRGGRNRSSRSDSRGPASRPLLASDEPEGEAFAEEERDEESAEASEPREGGEAGSEERERDGRRRRSRRGRRGGQRTRTPRDGETPEGETGESMGEAAVSEEAFSDSPVDAVSDSPSPAAAEEGGAKPRARRTRSPRSRSPRSRDEAAEPSPEASAPMPQLIEKKEPPVAKPAPAAAPAANLHAPIEKPSDQPKRKGWWSKITG